MGPKKVLSSFEPKKKVSSFSNYLNVPRSLSRRKKSSPSLSLSLFRFRNARAPSPKKESKQHNFAGVFGVPLFFFRKKRLSLGGQRTRTRVKCGFESEEKERSEMCIIKSTREREFFFCLSRESSCKNQRKLLKTSKTLNT